MFIPENYRLIIGSLSVALTWSIASIIQKDILKRIHQNTLFLYISILLCLVMIILAIVWNDTIPWHIPDIYTFFQIFMITLIGFLIPYSLLLHLMKDNDVNRVISLAYVTPVITVFLAWIFLGERINIYSILGAILIVAGGYIIANFTENTEKM